MLSNNDKKIMETTETRVCKCCGQERPISEFRNQRFGRASTCKSCLADHIAAGKKRKKEQAELSQKAEDARTLRLKDFEPRELMAELKRRGYEFTMTYTKTFRINSNDIEV